MIIEERSLTNFLSIEKIDAIIKDTWCNGCDGSLKTEAVDDDILQRWKYSPGSYFCHLCDHGLNPLQSNVILRV
jgi:hypothetical protein